MPAGVSISRLACGSAAASAWGDTSTPRRASASLTRRQFGLTRTPPASSRTARSVKGGALPGEREAGPDAPAVHVRRRRELEALLAAAVGQAVAARDRVPDHVAEGGAGQHVAKVVLVALDAGQADRGGG